MIAIDSFSKPSKRASSRNISTNFEAEKPVCGVTFQKSYKVKPNARKAALVLISISYGVSPSTKWKSKLVQTLRFLDLGKPILSKVEPKFFSDHDLNVYRAEISDFKAVKFMREVRDQISLDIQDMNFLEIKKYFEERRMKLTAK